MVRSALGKVAWVGRTASMVLGLAVVLALVVGVASAAFGANGQAWILGQSNVATAITKLAGTAGVDGPMLQLINNNEGTNDTALALNVQAGEAPMRVNSRTRVANLNAASAGRADSAANADQLDGKDSSDFVQNSGMTTYTVFGPWISGDPSVVKAEQSFHSTIFTNTGSSILQREIQLNPLLPTSLYGKSMLLTGVELCYNTSQEGVALGEVRLDVYSSTEPGSASGNHVTLDRSAPDGAFCRMFSGTPLLMKTNSFASLQAQVNWSAQTTFYTQRATFYLEPSNTAAAPQ